MERDYVHAVGGLLELRLACERYIDKTLERCIGFFKEVHEIKSQLSFEVSIRDEELFQGSNALLGRSSCLCIC